MDGTYAPRSPDLSGFQSSPSKQQLYQPGSQSYAPRSPVIPSYHSFPQYDSQQFGDDRAANDQYMPPIPALPPPHTFDAPTDARYYQPSLKQESSYPAYDTSNTTTYEALPEYPPTTYPSDAHVHPSYRIQSEPPPFTMSRPQIKPETAHPNPNPTGIEIKTKFPVARIKRIMQADEEVGKVAQVTPVAVNKALELFMIALVSGSAEKAREKGGKRVTAQHLKAVVEGDERWDFLRGIVEKVAEVQEGAGGETKAKKSKRENTDSEDEGEAKKKKGKGRRKKVDD